MLSSLEHDSKSNASADSNEKLHQADYLDVQFMDTADPNKCLMKTSSTQNYNNLIKISKQDYIYDYDISYYNTNYEKDYLNLDENIIKQYFTSNYTIPKILKIFSKLFNITILKIQESKEKYWNKDVDLYIINDNNSKNILGYMYLDLYPRDNKYTHAATFDLQNTYINNNNIRILPVTAIVCNFTLPEKNKNYSLLTFNELTTFCHELGHALHNILSNVKYSSLSGISMEEDFGEMPSQFFENWCYNKTFLKLISKNHITNKKIPLSIINIIIKNRYNNIGLHYLTQILYTQYDLKVHEKKNNTEKYLHNLWFKIANNLLPYKELQNTYPMCRFDHLMVYCCTYYGYLWSIIYAYDAFSIFEKQGLFNKKLGLRFRKEILEKGSTIKAINMLENFLKRKTSNKAFLQIFK